MTGLITVTSNLDHAVWTARNGVTPIRDSLNAANVAKDIQHIPQVHFIGGDDTNVMVADVEALYRAHVRHGAKPGRRGSQKVTCLLLGSIVAGSAGPG